MKRLINLYLLLLSTNILFAAQTTYTFTSQSWTSKVGTVLTDNKTDGWISDKDAYGYSDGFDTPAGPQNRGVQVTSKLSGAGATSVISFRNVRKVRINCSTTTKGTGNILLQIGDNPVITTPVATNVNNTDLDIDLPAKQSGQIRLTVECNNNSVYIHSVNIRATNASPLVEGLTLDTWLLVTNTDELQAGDQIVFGIADGKSNYIMGVYDESISRNNIHALKGVYSADRSTISPNADAVYTVGTIEANGTRYFTFADYTGYYLVASGGNPNKGQNNYLTVWDKTDSPNYGLYGGWSITVASTGEATILNAGKSRSNLLQYNPNSGTPIFACYSDFSQTPVALYKYIHVDASEPYIQAGIVNFGTVLYDGTSVTDERTIEINAINLTQDIQVSLAKGTVFSINKTQLDRDGDRLTISYHATEPDIYQDTLLFISGTTKAAYPIHLQVERRLTIAQAKEQTEQTVCYLQPVVITKKYDKHIFAEDETGSILLYDGGNLYGKDCKNGDILTNVTGKYHNYYGNPSLTLTNAFTAKAGETVLPALQTEPLLQADACRYVRIENAVGTDDTHFSFAGNEYALYDMFHYNPVILPDGKYDIEGIVYIYNETVLCPTSITQTITGLQTLLSEDIIYHNGIIENPNGKAISLYSATGKLLVRTRNTIDMHPYPYGVYILQCQQQTLKIIK